MKGGLALVVLLAALAACGDGRDRGSDAGDTVDASTADGGGTDATTSMDATTGDAGRDAGPDAGAGLDAGADAGADAGSDAGMDAGTDAGMDAGMDAGSDAGMDAGSDAGMDAGFDAGMDAGFDGGTDAGSDAGSPACVPTTARVTNDSAQSNDPILAWNGTGYGVTWSDTRDGNSEIYFALLDTSGAITGTELRVTNASGNSEGLSMVWTGTEYGVSWYDDRSGQYQIYFTRVSAAGVEIGDDIQVTTDGARSWGPSLVWNGSGWAVAWWDVRDGTDEVYFARLDSAGSKIGSDVRVTTGGDANGPVMVWTGTEYALAWGDRRDGAGSEIYFTRLDSAGSKIGSDIRLTTTTSGSSGLPSLVWNGTEYGLGFEDSRTGSQELWFVRLDATGSKIGTEVSITDRLFSPWNMVWDGTGYAMAWMDSRDGNPEIYFTRLDATGARLLGDVRITDDPAISRAPSTAWNGTGYAVAWSDLEHGNWEVHFADPCP